MYEQLAKVRDEKEAAARPGGQDWNGTHTAGRPRIILVSRRLPYKLQVSFCDGFRRRRRRRYFRRFVDCGASFRPILVSVGGVGRGGSGL